MKQISDENFREITRIQARYESARAEMEGLIGTGRPEYRAAVAAVYALLVERTRLMHGEDAARAMRARCDRLERHLTAN